MTALGCAKARANTWQPSSGHTQIQIWPSGAVPDPMPSTGIEDEVTESKTLIGGKTVLSVNNVTHPTMTVYSPSGKNTGAAVVVFPGGGYQVLAIDLEGTEICDWLTSKGITCMLLKYRVPGKWVGPYRESPLALQDAQRALGLLRFRASEWHVDPHKVGVIGFSAGGHLLHEVSFCNRFRLTDLAHQLLEVA